MIDYYLNVNGKIAFLAGVVSTLSYKILGNIFPSNEVIATDVFEANENNLCYKMRERFCSYAIVDKDNKISEYAKKIDFELQMLPESLSDNIQTIFSNLEIKCNKKEKQYIDEFVNELRLELGNIISVYRIEGTPNKWLILPLSKIYTYIVSDILFVKFSRYIVMIVFGSNE